MNRLMLLLTAALLSAMFATGCTKDMSGDSDTLLAAAIAAGRDFSLANSQTSSSTRLDILYDKSFHGTINYIVSTTDLDITNQTGFNASSATKTTVTITADDLIYDDYIPLSSLASGTKYYVYILNSDTGKVTALTETTKTSSTSVQETGTFPGYGGDITYYINFPAAYNPASIKKWPLLISIKAPNFTSNDPNFPCITFDTDISYSSWVQINYDIEELRKKLNSIIEDSSYRINRYRIYACGFSAGGCAAMKIANNYDGTSPYTVAALAVNGISDWLGSNAEWTGNLGDTDIWISCGENDPYGADVAYETMPTGRGEHLLTVYPDLGHDSSPTWASPYTFMWLLSK